LPPKTHPGSPAAALPSWINPLLLLFFRQAGLHLRVLRPLLPYQQQLDHPPAHPHRGEAPAVSPSPSSSLVGSHGAGFKGLAALRATSGSASGPALESETLNQLGLNESSAVPRPEGTLKPCGGGGFAELTSNYSVKMRRGWFSRLHPSYTYF